jgi:HSP20 family protein
MTSYFETFGTDPFREMRQLQSQMDRLFSQMASATDMPSLQGPTGAEGEGATAGSQGSAGTLQNAESDAGSGKLVSRGGMQHSFWPLVDVKESDKAITMHAELPGMRKEDINIHVEGNMLHISGQRSQEKKQENENWRRVERSYGSFRRSFRLPEGVKEDNIKAMCKDGVLEVVVPKPATPKAVPKKVTVQ